MPLKLHDYAETKFDGGCLEYLDKAANIQVTENIEQMHTLSFEYPMIDDKAEKITENRIVSVEGQAYRIFDVSRIYSGTRILRAKAQRIFFIDARNHHLPNVPDMIGVDPYKVIRKAVENTRFELISDDELSRLGMKRIGADGLLIDFFSTDKINTYDIITNVIESAGQGELYVDNYRIAVVERIGVDNGVRLSLTKNLKSLTIQYACDEIATRLYAYGKDDLTISSVNGGLPYIESPNVEKYGIIEGYKDYGDYTDPEKIKAHAEWDLMGEDNDKRLDTSRLTIVGDVIDLSKIAEYGDMEKIHLGDTVRVEDGDTVHKKRVVNMVYYPYESKQPTITIGLVSTRNMFFAAWQKQRQFKNIQKNSSRGNKIKTKYFTGTLNSDQNNIKSENERLKLEGDFLTIRDNKRIRAELGNSSKGFGFWLYDADGNPVIYFDESGNGTFSGIIRGGKILSDTDIAVNKDANVGRYLRVGYIRSYENANGETIYEWYDDSNIQLGPGASISATNKGDNLVFSALSRLELNASSVTKNGAEVATQEYIDEIMRDHVKNYHNIS